jgi:hypothetical protein
VIRLVVRVRSSQFFQSTYIQSAVMDPAKHDMSTISPNLMPKMSKRRPQM